MKRLALRSRASAFASLGSALFIACTLPFAAAATTDVFSFPTNPWIGFMNVFTNVNGAAGAYEYGATWDTGDLAASFTGQVLALAPNTSIDRDFTSDPYWWVGGTNGLPAQIMDANFYVQDDTLAGQTVVFSGYCSSNTLVPPYTSVAFIKDFTADYTLYRAANVPLVTGQAFSISLMTAAGDHIQYGFETIGPDARQTAVTGLGSVIIRPVPPSVVTSAADDGSAGTLRTIISNSLSGDTIIFTNTLSGGTITLTNAGGQLPLNNNLTIDASALSNGIAINGNHASRIFGVAFGATVALDSLTLTNGYCGADYGGAILNLGTLNVNRCAIVGNSTDNLIPDDGGGIFNYGILTLANSTFYNNSAWEGGAVRSVSSALLVTNCTFAANRAGVGGACSSANQGPPSVFNQVTIVGNNAVDNNGNGGGLFFYDQRFTIINCIVADNTDVYGDESDIFVYNFPGDPVSFLGSNLVQDFYYYGVLNELIGLNTISNSPPNLAPLGNYGGPTLTMPPLPGSPAIGSAVGSTPATDQRGHPRPVASPANIGAVEGVFDPAIPLGKPKPVLANGKLSSLQLGFTNLSGASFTVLASTNVALPVTNWTVLGQPTESPVLSGHYLFTDPQVTNSRQKFYRVRWH